jgi:hypothetical protein
MIIGFLRLIYVFLYRFNPEILRNGWRYTIIISQYLRGYMYILIFSLDIITFKTHN